MIGLGNTTQNASISFSQHGDTTVQGSYSLGGGVQLAGDVTTNGAANFGLNFNPTGEGPRRDWNFSLMYDLAGTGLSASVGYTDPGSTMGLTSTVNRDGLSTSAELTGVSIATNGPNGFQMDEINFAEKNINEAQDATQDDPANKNKDDDNSPKADDGDLLRDFAEAGTVLAVLLTGGAAVVTGLFGGGSPTTSTGGNPNTTPTAGETAVLERDRRREDEDTPRDDQDPPTPPNVAQVMPSPAVKKEDATKSPEPAKTDNAVTERGSDKSNPQSSILIRDYDQNIVDLLRSTISNVNSEITRNSSPEKILSSTSEGINLKKATDAANLKLQLLAASPEYTNLRQSIESTEKGIKVIQEQLKTLSKGSLEYKSWSDALSRSQGSLRDLKTQLSDMSKPIVKELNLATSKQNEYVAAQVAKISTDSNTMNKAILDVAKKLAESDSASIDPRIKDAYAKIAEAERQLLSTNTNTTDTDYKKALNAYDKAKSDFLSSNLGRDIGKQLQLADGPDVYSGKVYEKMPPETVMIKDTYYKVEASERLRIAELKTTLETREIKNPESRLLVESLQTKYQAEVKAFETNPKVIEANQKIENLNSQIAQKYAEFEKNPPSETERTKFESDMKKKLIAENKIISEAQKEMIKAEKTYLSERLTIIIKEDPSLFEGSNKVNLNTTNRKDAVYDLFYGKEDRDISSAANSLFDDGVKFGEATPLASKVITEESFPTKVNGLPEGAGYVRYMDFYGEKLILPGVPGSPITSDFGQRNDPKTGSPALHLGTDNAVPRGSVIGTPVQAEVFSTNNESLSGENSRHSQGLGKSVTFAIPDRNSTEQVRMTVGHNGEILVQPGDTVKPGQAISISSNSGRSIGDPGDHTHVEFSFYVGTNPKTGEMNFETRVPTAKDIPLLKKLGLIK
ncbi:hypothetical protein ND856_00425 [Leptospira bandrabouensis]|uniref:hypothetical protein n=1 Tax=Leptospira bandrabouensis TaxID=2484903 RepID=UPI00223CEF47|nr:hypothetical protein [Leptospira bandrabouensis]MCW7456785.1 hypothetical protein [Leptospira bandrabouensis]MCW7475731.1 hypothetical protein [Leptospira bandrabouensis]MCW7483413.1 hypothetical protein [Leptospira bandrabouensis]